jgi:hypothetical protein
VRALSGPLTFLTVLGSGILGSCGGGGGSATATPTQTDFTVGGTVTGLVGAVTLQLNGANSLALQQNGTFVFSSNLKAGADYSVSILNQPLGPTCTVSNGSGTVTANVTDVSISCSADSSTIFLPLLASPVLNPATGAPYDGTTGLFVVSSKSVATAPVLVSPAQIDNLGFVMQFKLDPQGNVSSGLPSSFIYSTNGVSGGDHIWALSLTGDSTLTPKQLSNLTIPSHGSLQFCTKIQIMKNLSDPTSALFLLQIPATPSTACYGGTSWILVHLTDSATTTPVNLPPLLGPVQPLYLPDGNLSGLLTLDAAHNLVLYPDETFTHPTQILANVATFETFQPPPASSLTSVSYSPTFSYIVVHSPTALLSLYRIDNTGPSADLYDFQGDVSSGFLFDAQNFYFTDTAGGAAFSEALLQIPISGGTTQLLYQLTASSATPLNMIGSTKTDLILLQYPSNPATGLVNTEIDSLSIGTPGTPAVLANYSDFANVVFSGGDIFVTFSKSSGSSTEPFAYSSQILSATGSVIQPLTPQSSFTPFSVPPMLQFNGITDPGGLGGATVSVIDLSEPANPRATPFKLSSGQNYALPTGTGSAGVYAVTPTMAIGNGADQGHTFALAYDLAKDLIAQIAMDNTNVSFLQAPAY